MKVQVKGKGEVNLSQTHYVAQGGQASVYARDGIAYKIYSDPKFCLPEGKFLALQKIKDPNVIKPEDLLEGKHIGYTMKFLQNKFTLCQVFPKAFRDRNGFGHDKAHELVQCLQNHIQRVHDADVLIVDLNEFNILTDLKDCFLIDVDSYQAPGYPAEVIMPSVRDWSVKPAQFSKLSDWYSFAILAAQLYMGIHPYRGTYSPEPKLPLEERMKRHLSVFCPEVRTPGAAYKPDVIPTDQRQWLKAVLQDGKRLPPPRPGALYQITVQTVVQAVLSLDAVEIAEVRRLACKQILDVLGPYCRTDAGIFHGTRKVSPEVDAVLGDDQKAMVLRPVATGHNTYKPVWLHLDQGSEAGLLHNALSIVRSEGDVYVRTKTEVLWRGTHPVAQVMELSTQMFEGCVLQDMLGSMFVSLLRGKAGFQVRMPELDPKNVGTIIEAKHEGGVLMVLTANCRWVFRFDENFASYDVRKIDNVPLSSLNFVTLEGKVAVCLTEEESLEVFPTKKGASGLKTIQDKGISSDMRLMHVNGRVGFAKGNVLYSMRMK